MTIYKPRNFRRRRGNGRNRSAPRRERLRTEAEQLDYEMELHRAKREGREQEFLAEERAKMRARRASQLDDEMDAYFKKRDEAVAAKAKADDTEGKPEGNTNGAANDADPADSTDPPKSEADKQETTDTKAN